MAATVLPRLVCGNSHRSASRRSCRWSVRVGSLAVGVASYRRGHIYTGQHRPTTDPPITFAHADSKPEVTRWCNTERDANCSHAFFARAPRRFWFACVFMHMCMCARTFQQRHRPHAPVRSMPARTHDAAVRVHTRRPRARCAGHDTITYRPTRRAFGHCTGCSAARGKIGTSIPKSISNCGVVHTYM